MRMPSVYISLHVLFFFTVYVVFVLAYKCTNFKSLTWLEAKHRSPTVSLCWNNKGTTEVKKR